MLSETIHPMQIRSFTPAVGTVLAPMAGVTDAAFRRLARDFGAGWTVGEMVASEARLRETEKTTERFRIDPQDPFPVVQLLGSDPGEMASAAQFAQTQGARAVDINFGCPARVVCGKACGSALMQEPELAEAIVRATVAAVEIPVTVKMRTGWNAEHKNAVELARRFEASGAALLTVHGRTRADKFSGHAEYRTIADVAHAVSIPVIANGDITTPEKALSVMEVTGAAGVMMGRGAVGNPWLFSRTKALLEGRRDPGEPSVREVRETIRRHFAWHLEASAADARYALRSFRKFLPPYLAHCPGGVEAARGLVREETPEGLLRALDAYFQIVA